MALERAATAREAVQVMGKLVEEFGFLTETGGGGETMTITDGTETWVAEFYGRDIWAAVRIPEDHVFVAANRARIGEINLADKANVLAAPKIVSFAVEQGWFDPKAGKPFVVHEIYAPDDPVTSSRREWRVFDLIAPSLKLPPDLPRYPFSVKPDKPLTLEDIRKIQADYYEGTPYDMTKGPAAGPWGDPIRYVNRGGKGSFERSINVQRTYYLHIGQVNASLPEPLRGTSWFGYGAPDTSYLTPLWAIMNELPAFLGRGDRYGTFDRESGCWTNIYVQQMAELHYNEAIKHVRAAREPRLKMLYEVTPKLLARPRRRTRRTRPRHQPLTQFAIRQRGGVAARLAGARRPAARQVRARDGRRPDGRLPAVVERPHRLQAADSVGGQTAARQLTFAPHSVQNAAPVNGFPHCGQTLAFGSGGTIGAVGTSSGLAAAGRGGGAMGAAAAGVGAAGGVVDTAGTAGAGAWTGAGACSASCSALILSMSAFFAAIAACSAAICCSIAASLSTNT